MICLDRCGICGKRFRKVKSILILVLRVLKDRCLAWVFLDSMEASLVIIFLSLCVYGCVSIANFVKYLKKRVIGTIGATYDYAHWFFYLLLQHGVTALSFFPFPTLLFSLVCICLFVCPSACLCVCVCV